MSAPIPTTSPLFETLPLTADSPAKRKWLSLFVIIPSILIFKSDCTLMIKSDPEIPRLDALFLRKAAKVNY